IASAERIGHEESTRWSQNASELRLQAVAALIDRLREDADSILEVKLLVVVVFLNDPGQVRGLRSAVARRNRLLRLIDGLLTLLNGQRFLDHHLVRAALADLAGEGAVGQQRNLLCEAFAGG